LAIDADERRLLAAVPPSRKGDPGGGAVVKNRGFFCGVVVADGVVGVVPLPLPMMGKVDEVADRFRSIGRPPPGFWEKIFNL
jgi:hypothetical protein